MLIKRSLNMFTDTQTDYFCFTEQTKFFHSTLEEAFSDEIAAEFNEFIDNRNSDSSIKSERLYRNGSYSRFISTPMGYINISIPRDRKSYFHPRFLPRYQRTNSTFRDKIDAIILKSFSYSSCASTINTIYEDKDFSISDKTVSRYAKAIAEKLKYFNSSPLPSSLFAVYLDTTYLPFHLPNNSIRKVGLSIALGLNTELRFQVLAYTLCSHETQKIYTELLNNIKSRGVDSVAVIVGDGMPGIEKACSVIYKNALFQQCLAHIKRNLKNYISDGIRSQFTRDFNKILKIAQSYDEAIELYNRLYEKYGSLSFFSPFWQIAPNKLFAYLKFSDKDLQVKIRTSNPIESLNSHIKRKIHNRIASSETTLLLDLFSVFTDFNSNQLTKRPKNKNQRYPLKNHRRDTF